jgi:hypothetical protein
VRNVETLARASRPRERIKKESNMATISRPVLAFGSKSLAMFPSQPFNVCEMIARYDVPSSVELRQIARLVGLPVSTLRRVFGSKKRRSVAAPVAF